MKLLVLVAGLLAGPALCARADATNIPVKIGALAAADHYNQLMTVTGVVAQVSIRPSIIFINLDQPYPDSPFAAVIHSAATNQFGDLRALKGRAVEITGKVVNYRDHPEILLEKSAQLLVSGGRLTATNSPAPTAHPAPSAPKGTNDLTSGVM